MIRQFHINNLYQYNSMKNNMTIHLNQLGLSKNNVQNDKKKTTALYSLSSVEHAAQNKENIHIT
jgi:hypothetical protein